MRFGPLAEAREVLKCQGNQVLKDPECSKYHSAITDWPGQHHYWCRWTSPLPQWGNVVPVKASPLYSSSICWPNLDHIFIICMPRSREKVKKLFFPQIGRRHFISSIIRILGYSSETEKRVRCSTAEPERCPEHLQKSLQNENYYPHFIVMGTKAQKKKKPLRLLIHQIFVGAYCVLLFQVLRFQSSAKQGKSLPLCSVHICVGEGNEQKITDT